MWYFSETFLHPRTETCCSVSFRGSRTHPTSNAPPIEVLQRSRLVKRVAMGTTTRLRRRSRANCLDCHSEGSGEVTPGETRLLVGWGRRKDSVFHARG